MEPAKIDLTIYQGATFRKSLVWKSDDEVVDLTGYTARMQVRESVDSDSALIALTTENDRIAITEAEGKIDLVISAADTSGLSFGSAVYDLELEKDDEVTRLCGGKVKLSREVTR